MDIYGKRNKKVSGSKQGVQGILRKWFMKIKILSQKVRGANDPDNRKLIRAFIRSNSTDLVCHQETKFKMTYVELVRSLGGGILSIGWPMTQRKPPNGFLFFVIPKLSNF